MWRYLIWTDFLKQSRISKNGWPYVDFNETCWEIFFSHNQENWLCKDIVYWILVRFDAESKVQLVRHSHRKDWKWTKTFLVGLKRLIMVDPTRSMSKLAKNSNDSHRTIRRADNEDFEMSFHVRRQVLSGLKDI